MMDHCRDIIAYLERARDPTGRHRRLIVVPDPHANAAVADSMPVESLIIASSALGNRPIVSPARSRKLLGQSFPDALIDAREGFDLDAFAVASGTLRGGGLLVVLAPALDAWVKQADVTMARWLSWPFKPADCVTHFRQRWLSLLKSDPTVAIYPEPFTPWARTDIADVLPPPAHDDPDCITTDQANAVACVLRVARGHRRRPCVLTADRGRGKSTALGIAAARLDAEGFGPILITGPDRAAADTLMERASTNEVTAPAFVPADELLRHHHAAALVLVDEAAALPAPVLEALLRQYPRIAFATTTHGYEGTGHGFRVRFQAVLEEHTPNWRHCVLQRPIRWAVDDPLEAFTFRALLLNAEATPLPADAVLTGEVHEEDRAALAWDETTLRSFFGLLVDAHYQTRPQDLRRALEAPDTRLWSIRDQVGRILAAAITLDEGGLPAHQAQSIALGRRRLRGHLLPQSLAAHAGLTQACGPRYRRLHRIAVHPQAQRRGLGRQLIQGISEYARADGLDALATAFGATPGLLAFWQHSGLVAVHMGNRRDAASASHSVFMLRALSDTGKELFEQARKALATDLPWRTAGVLSAVPGEIIAALLDGLPSTPLSLRDHAVAHAFAHGKRGPDDAGAALQRLTLASLTVSSHRAALSNTAITLLIGRFLQHQTWSELAAATGLSGRRELIHYLRNTVSALLVSQAEHE